MLFFVFIIILALICGRIVYSYLDNRFSGGDATLRILFSVFVFSMSSILLMAASMACFSVDNVVKTTKQIHSDFPVLVDDRYNVNLVFSDLEKRTIMYNCGLVFGSDVNYLETVQRISYGSSWLFPRKIAKFIQEDLGMPFFQEANFIHVGSLDDVVFEIPELNVYD